MSIINFAGFALHSFLGIGTSYPCCFNIQQEGNVPVLIDMLNNLVRPDQFNLLLLGYCEVKIGPSDRKKRKKKTINWGVVIDHNLIKTD